jgi:hypothetical protein
VAHVIFARALAVAVKGTVRDLVHGVKPTQDIVPITVEVDQHLLKKRIIYIKLHPMASDKEICSFKFYYLQKYYPKEETMAGTPYFT